MSLGLIVALSFGAGMVVSLLAVAGLEARRRTLDAATLSPMGGPTPEPAYVARMKERAQWAAIVSLARQIYAARPGIQPSESIDLAREFESQRERAEPACARGCACGMCSIFPVTP